MDNLNIFSKNLNCFLLPSIDLVLVISFFFLFRQERRCNIFCAQRSMCNAKLNTLLAFVYSQSPGLFAAKAWKFSQSVQKIHKQCATIYYGSRSRNGNIYVRNSVFIKCMPFRWIVRPRAYTHTHVHWWIRLRLAKRGKRYYNNDNIWIVTLYYCASKNRNVLIRRKHCVHQSRHTLRFGWIYTPYTVNTYDYFIHSRLHSHSIVRRLSFVV